MPDPIIIPVDKIRVSGECADLGVNRTLAALVSAQPAEVVDIVSSSMDVTIDISDVTVGADGAVQICNSDYVAAVTAAKSRHEGIDAVIKNGVCGSGC